LERKTLGKSPLVKPRTRWEDTIEMDLRVMGCENMKWMDVAEDHALL
jgi:hypothetical protein